MTVVSAEIYFQSFLQKTIVSNSGMGKEVHFLMLSVQHFLCRPWRRPPSKVPRRMVLEKLPWRVTCLNYASFRLLTVSRSSCGPTKELILPRTQFLVLCSKKEMRRSFLRHFVSKARIFLFFLSKSLNLSPPPPPSSSDPRTELIGMI